VFHVLPRGLFRAVYAGLDVVSYGDAVAVVEGVAARTWAPWAGRRVGDPAFAAALTMLRRQQPQLAGEVGDGEAMAASAQPPSAPTPPPPRARDAAPWPLFASAADVVRALRALAPGELAALVEDGWHRIARRRNFKGVRA
jgi:hypothetical protein